MPARSTIHLCALTSEFGEIMAHLHDRYGRRGLNLSWTNLPAENSEIDYRPSLRKSISKADGVLFLLGRQHGPEIPDPAGGAEKPQGYLEFAAEVAEARGIPVGYLLLGPIFSEGQLQESPAKIESQKAFNAAVKKQGKFVKTVNDDDSLASANSEFREFLQGKSSGLPVGWIVGLTLAGVSLFGGMRLWKVFHPVDVEEMAVLTPQSAAAAAFDGPTEAADVQVRNAAPLPPTLSKILNTPQEKKPTQTIQNADPKVVENFTERLLQIRRLIPTGQIALTRKALSQLLPECEAALGATHSVTLSAHLVAGEIATAEGALPTAQKILQDAQQVAQQELGASHRVTMDALSLLGGLYWQMADYPNAETSYSQLCERLVGLQKTPTEEPSPELSVAKFSLARAIIEQNRPKEALPLLQDALGVCIKQFGKYHPRTQNIQQLIQRCQQ